MKSGGKAVLSHAIERHSHNVYLKRTFGVMDYCYKYAKTTSCQSHVDVLISNYSVLVLIWFWLPFLSTVAQFVSNPRNVP